MDAASLLKRQGWRGEGHALSHTGNGIVKPLLVSKKVDVLGVGLNKHAAVSDQWWMRAFDQGLKDLGTGKQTVLSSVREKGVHYGGLYGRFVKGDSVPGTFTEEDTDTMAARTKRKRAMDDIREVKKQRKIDKAERAKVLRKEHAESAVTRQKKDLDKQAKAFVYEAMQRGLMLRSDKFEPKGSGPVAETYGEDAVLEVFKQAGLKEISSSKVGGKQAKYDQGKQRRSVERAARAYLLAQLPENERAEIDQEDEREAEQKKKRRRDEQAEKDAAAAAKAAEEEEKRLRKKQKKEERKKQKLEQQAEEKSEIKAEDEFTTGVDEVKLLDTPVPPKKAKKTKEKSSGKETNPSEVLFAVDTTGDEGLAADKSKPKSEVIEVVDNDGKLRHTFEPGETIPLDPTIWDGITTKKLPRAVRTARREYMHQKREARKAREAAKTGKAYVAPEDRKSRGQRKIEQREHWIMEMLTKSRKSTKLGDGAKTMMIGDREVPLVKVETMNGPFSREEMSLARTAARRIMKEKKREDEAAEKAKGKKVKERRGRH